MKASLLAGPASEHGTRLRRDTTGRNLKEKKAAEGGLNGGRHSRERDLSRAERECPDAPARSPLSRYLGPRSFPPAASLSYPIEAAGCSGRLRSGVFYP